MIVTIIYIAMPFTLMHKAAIADDTVILERLLRQPNKSPNIRSDTGETPLYWAVWHGKTLSVQLLLAYGADPNIPNIHLTTPIYKAIYDGDHIITGMLLKAGATLNMTNCINIRPLDCAIYRHYDDQKLPFINHMIYAKLHNFTSK